MKPAEIGQLISIVIWLISFIMVRLARKIDDEVSTNFFTSIEITALGFMWIFVGFKSGWW